MSNLVVTKNVTPGRERAEKVLENECDALHISL
jgi:hypothetical protein